MIEQIEIIFLTMSTSQTTLDIIKLIFDFIVTFIAISGVYFSINAMRKSKEDSAITLKEIEKNDLKYKVEQMPILKLEIPSGKIVNSKDVMCNLIDLDLILNASLINVGKGIAKDINLIVDCFYEESESEFRIKDNSDNSLYEHYYIIPIFNYKNGELIKGTAHISLGNLNYEQKYSLLGAGAILEMSDDFLRESIHKSCIDCLYTGVNKLRGYNNLFYKVNISYKSIFGDSIATEQIIQRKYDLISSETPEKIDGIYYGEMKFEFSFLDESFEIKSDILNSFK